MKMLFQAIHFVLNNTIHVNNRHEHCVYISLEVEYHP